MNDDRNILDHIRVLIRWRRMIILSFVLVVTSTVGISFLMPKAYRASAIVYPPLDSKGTLGLGNLLGDLQGSLLGGLGGESISATEFVPILQSERVRIAVADSFHLSEKYGAQHRSELLDKMTNNLQVELSREQFLSISYEADTPQLSADITNAFVAELEKALQERTRKQKRTYREYLERRLSEAEQDMFDAEQQYKNFQKENMAIDMEAQAKAQIESASTIIQSLVDLIVKRDIAAQMMTPDNPNLKQLDVEIRTTNRALDHLLMGSSADSSEQKTTDPKLPAIFKPFNQIPQLGLTSLQLLRDIQIQNAIYQFVKQEYEKTRFEEEKVSSAVIVLDKAVPPDVRSKPRRTLMVLVAGGLSLAISCLFAFLFEAIGNLTPENRAKIDAISNDLRGKFRA